MAFWLEYYDNGQKQEFSFDSNQVSVGRDQSADFVLDHPTVSRQHAVIVVDPHASKLVVLSRGGMTALNGQQVSGEVPLYDGSQLHFGQFAFTFRTRSQQPAGFGVPQGGMNPGMHHGGMRPGMHQGGMNPGMPQGGMQPGMPQGGMNPGMPQGGMQPGMPQGGVQQAWSPAEDSWSSGAGFDQVGDAKLGRKTGPSAEIEAPKEFPNPNTGGIKSWDEIAAGADDEEENYDAQAASNFERLQAAQKKANAQSKGNPVVLIGGLGLAAAMLTWAFWPASPTAVAVQTAAADRPEISWTNTDIKCSVPADCKAQAVQAYMFASETYDKKDVDVVNLYVAYKNMEKATKLLEQGSISEPVPELDGLENKKAAALTEINDRFKQLQIKYKNYEKRKMFSDMAQTLNEIQAYFPDKRHKKNLWAIEMERKMRDAGIYPNNL